MWRWTPRWRGHGHETKSTGQRTSCRRRSGRTLPRPQSRAGCPRSAQSEPTGESDAPCAPTRCRPTPQTGVVTGFDVHMVTEICEAIWRGDPRGIEIDEDKRVFSYILAVVVMPGMVKYAPSRTASAGDGTTERAERRRGDLRHGVRTESRLPYRKPPAPDTRRFSTTGANQAPRASRTSGSIRSTSAQQAAARTR